MVVNDAHYSTAAEWEHHDLVWKMNTKPNSDQTDRGATAAWMMGDEEIVYFMDLHGVSEQVTREAIKNAGIIAEDCNAEIVHADRMPRITRSEQEDLKLFLKQVEEGFERKVVQTDRDTDLYREQMDHEIEKITSRRFNGYFNVTADYIKHCKYDLDMFVGPGRGSSGGSLVAFLMDMTELDPMKYGLLFERFISDDREDYPDVNVEHHVVMDRPDAAIIESAKGAQLVVVGSRGRGGITGLLLGSTSIKVLRSAECPVMVVHK